MKKLLLVVLLLGSIEKCYAFGPEKSGNADADTTFALKPKRHFVWVNIGQLTQRELQLSYEKHTETGIAVEGTVGYKHPTKHNQEFDLSMGSISLGHYYDYGFRIPYFTGILAQLGLKCNFPGIPGAYLSGNIFYRYWFFNDQFLQVSNMDYYSEENFESEMSMRMHVNGFKVLMGYPLTIFRLPNNNALVMDFYCGLGIRHKRVIAEHKTYRDLRYYGPGGYPDREPFTARHKSWNVSPQIGYKVGFRF
ncbi:hypothetical protein I5M27_04730 [Adhaeribacter sp. BT258]|uniref:Outer membrane protein beta-barrel domain-containing protein n=1 Tax=Adhaeribacter terrigena TaxID=2793070 RepID=A0ABS1BZD4_9BACT|nr:hypothetical protein [Adhaeribacter terrigena]MBK0402277.1 hypothetical protein [Adhaeribacter terrigena]